MQLVIIFFKYMSLYDEELFSNIYKKSKIYNLDYSEIIDIVGCYPIYKGKEIIDYKLILPSIKSIDDILIYIHEYTHAIFMDEDELFPNIMEALFINYYISDEKMIKNIISNTKLQIKNSICEQHIEGNKIKLMIIKK